MSDPRIALVAEGPTDQLIIEAALKAILPTPFVLTQLQPEVTRPELGSGWGGVLKWCREFQMRGYASLEDDPTLEFYDGIIIHLDADVANKSYADCGPALEQEAQQTGWGTLPCSLACPPPTATVNNLTAVLLSWLGMLAIGNKTILCIPSKSSETWLAAAVFPNHQNLPQDIECTMSMDHWFTQLPKTQRIKKSRREYRPHAATITANWGGVRQLCSQADIFHINILQSQDR
ncbi:MAG: hypothetical protein KDJ28_04990 [Candidatus Competibacteraceae bacterium]|nr:hypothetical protein [Candidatus Competibacteraceae bacterium]